ncbi:MAG TPA: hypothetical protein VF904_08685 [Anaeromyxobacteraceae bacterium]
MKAALPLCLFAVTGCATFRSMGTARTVERGELQVFAAANRSRTVIASPSGTGAANTTPTFAQLEAGFRYGVTDGIEVGGSVWVLGAGAQGKLQLVRSPSPDTGVDVALAWATGLGGGSFPGGIDGDGVITWVSTRIISAEAAVPVGFNVGGGSQLVVTTRLVHHWYAVKVDGAASTTSNVLFAGGSLAFAWKVAESVTVLPEVMVLDPVSGPARGIDRVRYDGVVVQGGVGILFTPW